MVCPREKGRFSRAVSGLPITTLCRTAMRKHPRCSTACYRFATMSACWRKNTILMRSNRSVIFRRRFPPGSDRNGPEPPRYRPFEIATPVSIPSQCLWRSFLRHARLHQRSEETASMPGGESDRSHPTAVILRLPRGLLSDHGRYWARVRKWRHCLLMSAIGGTREIPWQRDLKYTHPTLVHLAGSVRTRTIWS
jgi:hypothetical protein